jgi:hypothetical protein
MQNPTINEIKVAYELIMDEACTDIKAQEILDDFVRHREIFDNIDMSKYKNIMVADTSTLHGFLTERKIMDANRKAMNEYKEELNNMSPMERWFHIEGMDDDIGKRLRFYIYKTKEGSELLSRVCIWDANKGEAILLIRDIFESISIEYPDYFKSEYVNDCVKEHGDDLAKWFVGIHSDGQRAIRTIYKCCKCFRQFIKGEPITDPSLMGW